jgi:hypothetical protein
MATYDSLDSTVIKKAGDYVLSDIRLVSYRTADGSNEPDKIAIETMVIEMNIYESIFNKTLSGNLVIIDANNVIGKIPLTGHERLEFKFFTPSLSEGYDFTIKTGNPMYVYKVQSRIEVNPRTQTYLLHFCSKEMLKNEQILVDNAPLGTHSEMLTSIVKGQSYLNSSKNLFYEPSLGFHKHNFNRLRPFDAIDDLSQLTRSYKFDNAGYYFYETSKGFYYRSLEHMLAVSPDAARPSLASFRPKPANIRINPGGEKDVKNEMQVVMDYRIKDQFDTLKNLRNGVYSSKLITHDQLNKTYNEYQFSYLSNYNNSQHTEYGANGTRVDGKGILPYALNEGKFMSDYAGVTYLWSSTQNKYDETVETPPIENILQKRLSQRLAFQSFKLHLTVNGFTGIQAGDVITFIMPSYSPNPDSEPLDNDPYISGRYLIASIRHQLNRKLRKHVMMLECIKDSVNRPYPMNVVSDTFINQEKEQTPGTINLYAQDDSYIEPGFDFFA